MYAFCRSYWKTIVCNVYGTSIREIWRKQDGELAENTSMYRTTSPGPHWMLVTVGRKFTIPFSKLILYRKKSRNLCVLNTEPFSIQVSRSQTYPRKVTNMDAEFSWAYNYLVLRRIKIGGGRKGGENDVRYITSENFPALMSCIMIRYSTRDDTLRSRRHFSAETSPKISRTRRKLN